MSSESSDSVFKIRTSEQFDGSVWRQYEFNDSIFILTGQGRQLATAMHLGKILRTYAEDQVAHRQSPNDTRRHLVEGGNASIFSVTELPFVIKESLPDRDQLIPALYRMDRLVSAIESHCPHWIGLPQHYGVYFSKKNPSEQFLMMQKIDEGITVGDILDYHDPRPDRFHMMEMATKIFGEITPELQEEVRERFGQIKGELRGALMKEYLKPEEYLPDIDTNAYNIVMDRLDVPVGGSHIKYWIIDQ